ncbi:hypothetical protein FKM82_006320 [Ascaphus truei]
MGNHVGKKDHVTENPTENAENNVVEEQKMVSEGEGAGPAQMSEDNEVFDLDNTCEVLHETSPSPESDADVNQNNGTSSEGTVVTDSTSTADPKNAWKDANPADTRPHLVRLFSRDAPGREDNTFKDRPSESDELQTIPEDSGTASQDSDSDLMASQKLSRGHGSKQMASASTSDHSRHGHGAHARHRDSGLLDSLGKFFGGERDVPRKGSGKVLSASRGSYYTSSPQKSSHHGRHVDAHGRLVDAHGRLVDDNPVVHFFKNIVSPRTPPPAQPKRGLSLARFSWGAEGQKPCYGGSGARYFEHHKSSHKGYKDAHRDGQGTLSKIFNLGGRDSRSSSPIARR